MHYRHSLVGTHMWQTGELELLLEEFEEEPLIIRAAYVQQRLLSARTRTFIDHLAKLIFQDLQRLILF
jgi:hypothetical protein